MDRTESIVVSVGPNFENSKINEMSSFGWNLQGRQEVIGHVREAEISDNLLVAIGRGMKEGATGTKTYQYDHYVKLHFVRSLALPNLARIKQLESEYFSLPFPGAKGVVWPILFTLMPLPATLGALADPLGKQGPGLTLLVLVIPWVLLGINWTRKRLRRRQVARATSAASQARAETILHELEPLLEVANT